MAAVEVDMANAVWPFHHLHK